MKSQDCYTAKRGVYVSSYMPCLFGFSTSIGVALTFGLSEQSLVQRFSAYSHRYMSTNIPDSIGTSFGLTPMELHIKNGAKPLRLNGLI